jgi:hypothetical protein
VSTTSTLLSEARSVLNGRCNAIEEAYEFMLAYAGQGIANEAGSPKGGQVRDFLRKAESAMSGIIDFVGRFSEQADPSTSAPYTSFLQVVDSDARAARAAVNLVIAQPSISSQVIDNLNASIHLRALLTDLFLIDEVLKSHGA